MLRILCSTKQLYKHSKGTCFAGHGRHFFLLGTANVFFRMVITEIEFERFAARSTYRYCNGVRKLRAVWRRVLKNITPGVIHELVCTVRFSPGILQIQYSIQDGEEKETCVGHMIVALASHCTALVLRRDNNIRFRYDQYTERGEHR